MSDPTCDEVMRLSAEVLLKERPVQMELGDTKVIITIDQISYWRLPPRGAYDQASTFLGQSSATDFIAYECDPGDILDTLEGLHEYYMTEYP